MLTDDGVYLTFRPFPLSVIVSYLQKNKKNWGNSFPYFVQQFFIFKIFFSTTLLMFFLWPKVKNLILEKNVHFFNSFSKFWYCNYSPFIIYAIKVLFKITKII